MHRDLRHDGYACRRRVGQRYAPAAGSGFFWQTEASEPSAVPPQAPSTMPIVSAAATRTLRWVGRGHDLACRMPGRLWMGSAWARCLDAYRD